VSEARRTTLLLARTDLLDRGLPGGVERARESLPRLESEYAPPDYAGVICGRQVERNRHWVSRPDEFEEHGIE
jgi:hypothetical protein